MTEDSYPYNIAVEVTFRDLDALGHVNNAVYLTYAETARIKYLIEVCELSGLQEIPVILAEVTCSYRSPAYFGERLRVGVGVTRFGTKSFDMIFRVDAEDGRLIATGKTVLVMFDYASGRTIPVPDSFKERFLAYQGGWQPPAP